MAAVYVRYYVIQYDLIIMYYVMYCAYVCVQLRNYNMNVVSM